MMDDGNVQQKKEIELNRSPSFPVRPGRKACPVSFAATGE